MQRAREPARCRTRLAPHAPGVAANLPAPDAGDNSESGRLLDSACHRPRTAFFGREAYPSLTGKAAALMHSIACHHALVDGNKRLALLATVVFLRINGHCLDLPDDEAFDLTVSVAAGQLDAKGIEKNLRLAPAQ
jgi:death on curing protein